MCARVPCQATYTIYLVRARIDLALNCALEC